MFGKRRRKTVDPPFPQADGVDPHPRFVELEVRTALDTLAAPDAGSDDDAVVHLIQRGISAERARKLVQLVPEAMAHIVIEGIGVTSPEQFKIKTNERDVPAMRDFRSEPYYRVARRLAKDAYVTGYRELLIAIGGRSATWKAVSAGQEQGYTLDQLSGAKFNVVFWGLEPEVWDAN
ncbi:MAG: hypothetical protein QNJ88_14995 [Acidimicrobiia bacterium]|nr:hypothetical protein [Acidimicrobiia bacterium]